ncbi:hypothetical protein [Streptomyces virginiae]|uniref:hypothetical protein n=1 Tax=Streptomyces virginiae TaxID=1961 RepID=UPI0036BA6781
MTLPVQLADEQREELLRATAQLTAGFQALAAALLPAVQQAAAHFRALYEAFQAAGLIDKNGNPIHIGKGENAEDCIACRGTNPPWPFLCPGQPEPGPSCADMPNCDGDCCKHAGGLAPVPDGFVRQCPATIQDGVLRGRCIMPARHTAPHADGSGLRWTDQTATYPEEPTP